jgi:hypothetical protein
VSDARAAGGAAIGFLSSPKPAGLAMGAGFPLFVTGTLILLVGDLPTALNAIAAAMVLVGAVLFFDPR